MVPTHDGPYPCGHNVCIGGAWIAAIELAHARLFLQQVLLRGVAAIICDQQRMERKRLRKEGAL